MLRQPLFYAKSGFAEFITNRNLRIPEYLKWF